MGGAAEAKKGIFHRFAVDLSPIDRSATNHDVGPDKNLAIRGKKVATETIYQVKNL